MPEPRISDDQLAGRIELAAFCTVKPHLRPMLDDELGPLRVNLLDAIGAALALDLQEARAEVERQRKTVGAIRDAGLAAVASITADLQEVRAQRDALRVVVQRLHDGQVPVRDHNGEWCWKWPGIAPEPVESELVASILTSMEGR